MLKQRTLTALVLAPLVIAAVIWLPTVVVATIAASVFLLGFWEWTRLAGYRNPQWRLILVAGFGALMGLSTRMYSPTLLWAVIVVGACWWLLALLWLRRFSFAAAPTRENGLLKLLAGVLTIFPAWAALIWLHGHHVYGLLLLLALFVVWSADIGAYFAGRYFGRAKLAPQISPGKTWAGVFGALLVSALVAGLGAALLDRDGADVLGMILVGLVSVAASIVGDLFESLLKRHTKIKDSGRLFPGHGGLLDRLDSVFAALPFFAVGVALFHL